MTVVLARRHGHGVSHARRGRAVKLLIATVLSVEG